MYGEATLKPEGDQKEAIDAILAKFPGGGQAGDKLKDLIEKGLRESDAPVSFKEDIEPWLGDEAAFFIASIGPNGQDPQSAAGLIATDDEDEARAALEKSAEGKLTKKNYKDVEYLSDESGEVGAVFDGYLVLGTEAGVKAAIDTSEGGKKLSEDESYKNALDDAADDRLGFFYMNSPELLRSLRGVRHAAAGLCREVLRGAAGGNARRRQGRRDLRGHDSRGDRPRLALRAGQRPRGGAARRLVARNGADRLREADRLLRGRLRRCGTAAATRSSSSSRRPPGSTSSGT